MHLYIIGDMNNLFHLYNNKLIVILPMSNKVTTIPDFSTIRQQIRRLNM